MGWSRYLNAEKKQDTQTSEQRVSWAEGTTSARALRQECEVSPRSSTAEANGGGAA